MMDEAQHSRRDVESVPLRHSARHAIVLLPVIVLAVVVVTAMFYGGEDLVLRYRIAHDINTLEAVAVYDATKLKNGRYEIFRDQPQTEMCVHAMLPHFGHRPCWYIYRTRIRIIG